jgi:hypothetical protein
MALRDWFKKLFGDEGEEDSEPPVDIDAIKADQESARFAGEAIPSAAERFAPPDEP